MEVFAEPESTICLRGQKYEATLESEGRTKTTSTAVETSFSNSLSGLNGFQMIKAFGPVSSTWFFQCGRARFVTFCFFSILALINRPANDVSFVSQLFLEFDGNRQNF